MAQETASALDSLTSSLISNEVYSATTDPTLVDRPVEGLVHGALKHAWAINNNHKMSHIFDSVNPARQFRREMVYDQDASFPEHSSADDEYLTDTDGPAPGWMPFNPEPHR